jgi:hypothetical protein
MVVLSNPEDAPRADPHAGCCGSRGRKTPGDPISKKISYSGWRTDRSTSRCPSTIEFAKRT